MRKHLYETMPDGEDVLTPTCSEIVKRRSLAKVALDFRLSDHLFLTISEEGDLIRKPRILADSLEAVIGAVFLETDYCRTTDIVLNRIFHR
jgi:ribonuclease-3